eukprot:5368111-Alexandrium_andersonii.AAC.1
MPIWPNAGSKVPGPPLHTELAKHPAFLAHEGSRSTTISIPQWYDDALGGVQEQARARREG